MHTFSHFVLFRTHLHILIKQLKIFILPDTDINNLLATIAY